MTVRVDVQYTSLSTWGQYTRSDLSVHFAASIGSLYSGSDEVKVPFKCQIFLGGGWFNIFAVSWGGGQCVSLLILGQYTRSHSRKMRKRTLWWSAVKRGEGGVEQGWHDLHSLCQEAGRAPNPVPACSWRQAIWSSTSRTWRYSTWHLAWTGNISFCQLYALSSYCMTPHLWSTGTTRSDEFAIVLIRWYGVVLMKAGWWLPEAGPAASRRLQRWNTFTFDS